MSPQQPKNTRDAQAQQARSPRRPVSPQETETLSIVSEVNKTDWLTDDLKSLLKTNKLKKSICCSIFSSERRTLNLAEYHKILGSSISRKLCKFARIVDTCLVVSDPDISALKSLANESKESVVAFIDRKQECKCISYPFLSAIIRKTNYRPTSDVVDGIISGWKKDLWETINFESEQYSDIEMDSSPGSPLSDDPSAEEYFFPYRNFEDVIINVLVQKVGDRFRSGGLMHKELFERNVFSPMVHLTNCSGTGKTRAALELGKLTNVLYFKFGSNNGIKASKFGRKLTAYLCTRKPSHRLEVSAIVNVLLQRLLYMCGKVAADTDLDCLIPDEIISMYSGIYGVDGIEVLFSDLDKPIVLDSVSKKRFDKVVEYVDPSIFDRLSFGEIIQQLMQYNIDWLLSRRKKSKFAANPAVKRLPPLLIVMDEAHELMDKYQEKSSIEITNSSKAIDMYRLIKGCFRLFEFYWKYQLCITISTVANLENCSPTESHPSFRKTKTCLMYEPIILDGVLDCYRSVEFFENTVQDWNQFLFGRARLFHISNCGRPLWGAHQGTALKRHFEDRSEGTAESEYSICLHAKKSLDGSVFPFDIFGQSTFTEMWKKLAKHVDEQIIDNVSLCVFRKNKINDLIAYALLSLSAALCKFPKTINYSELVRVGPMALISIDPHSRRILAAAYSEGNFNGAATIMFMLNFEDVGRWFLSWISKNEECLLSTGEIGELLDRIAILRALYISKREPTFKKLKLPCPVELKTFSEFLFEPVGLEAFLVAYAGTEAARDYMNKRHDLAGAFLAFTHFITFSEGRFADAPFDIVADALSRGAAVIPPRGTAGVDAILPLVLSNGTLSFVFIQTKTGSSYKRLPTKKDVSMSSAENRLFSKRTNLDRAYCYIYRIQNVLPSLRHRVFESSEHQPCLALCGPLNVSGMEVAFQACLAWICLNERIVHQEQPANRSLDWRFKATPNTRESDYSEPAVKSPKLTRPAWDDMESLMNAVTEEKDE